MTPQKLAEIDRKVAEAIGAAFEMLQPAYLDKPACFLESRREFHPSTSWDDAAFALESYYAVDSIHIHRTKSLEWYANIAGEITYAQTGPLAISQSIIKLAKDPA